MSIMNYVRADLRGYDGYLSARKQNSGGQVWLNANESPVAQAFDSLALNRYPEPQPQKLREAMAAYYSVAPEQLLVTRGSDEAIDLLIRAACVPGQGRIAIQSPTFGMYAVCARLHGADVIDIPLLDEGQRFSWNIEAMVEQTLATGASVLFLCSPANPTGQSLPVDAMQRLLQALKGRCLVVIDEAYGEYSAQPSALNLLAQYENLSVLKTLSKAHALAGARVGGVIADPALIAVLKACQAPYPIAKPSAETALQALSPHALQATRSAVDFCLEERQRLHNALLSFNDVVNVYPSDANFLLVRFRNPEQRHAQLLSNGIVVRAMAQYPALHDCLRITVGSAEENNTLLTHLADQA